MSTTRSFWKGVLTGAATLATAAYIDHKVTESKFSPALKQAQLLDKEQVSRELNNYFFKAQAIESKCNRIALEGSDLILSIMPLPWDKPLRKTLNTIGRKMIGLSRKGKISQLLECGKDAKQLYARYEGIFLRANAILEATGKIPASLVMLSDFDRVTTNQASTANEDWETEFKELADAIRDMIDKTCAIAEELMEKLAPETVVAQISG